MTLTLTRLVYAMACLCLSLTLIAQQDINASFNHDGIDRSYIIHLPASYSDNGTPLPLVFNFHGLGSSASQQQYYSQMDKVADEEDFIVVYADGINNAWNVGWIINNGSDDIDFIDQLLDELLEFYNIDNSRVYSCGMSNGGFFSHYLACSLTHRFTAIASVTGSFSEVMENECNPSRTIPVMQIHGTADNVVPYEGLAFVGIPIEDVVDYWLNANGCSAQSDTTIINDINTTDGSTAEYISYNQCNHQSEVAFIKVTGGAHTWPSITGVGAGVNKDFDASVEIWKFFEKAASITSDIEDINSTQSIQVYPNPSDNFVNIGFNNYDPLVSMDVQLINATGMVVRNFKLNNKSNTIDVSTLPQGLYRLFFSGESYVKTYNLVIN